jgi:hypothetical protein
MGMAGRDSVTDREVRGLFGPIHVGGHRELKGKELTHVWGQLQENAEARNIIARRQIRQEDLPQLYQRFHDLITQ